MKEKELFKKLMSNELTEDEFFKYIEDEMVKESEFSREEVRYAIKLSRDPELCKKETGHTFHELYLMGQGFEPEEARYIEENSCIVGPREECDYLQKEGECHGCTNINGFLYWKTSPDEKLKPVKETWNELKKKSVVFISLGKKPTDKKI